MKLYNLFTGSFDMIVDKQGNHWFLECNQNGAWGWLDDIVKGRITEAFADAFERKLQALMARDRFWSPIDGLRKLSF